MLSSNPLAATSTPSSTNVARQSSASRLVVIDAGVENAQLLLSGVATDAAVLSLNPEQDGIAQITSAIRQLPHLTQLHIVAHGVPGKLQLGNGELSLTTLTTYASTLGTWFSSPEAELLLYSCNLAAGDAGEELVHKLQAATGARVAASSTKVGSDRLGGSWSLDVTTADFVPQQAFSAAAQADYPGTLTWFQAEKLLADETLNNFVGNQDPFTTSQGDRDNNDQFGSSVAIFDGFAIVGVPNNADIVDPATGLLVPGSATVGDVGSVYVFKVDPNDGSWQRDTQLIASDPVVNAFFGQSVDASKIPGSDDLYLVVGAPGARRPSEQPGQTEETTGAAYVFKRDATTGAWTQVQKIVHDDDDESFDQFGTSVGIDGRTIVVGAPNDSRSDTESQTGAIYIFETPGVGSDWAQVGGKITNPDPINPNPTLGASGDSFGEAIAIADGLIIVGSPNAAAPNAQAAGGQDTAGAAYIYRQQANGTWDTNAQKIFASDTKSVTGEQDGAAFDNFGSSVDIVNGYAIVGAPGNDIVEERTVNGQPVLDADGNPVLDTFRNAGSAYIFQDQSGTWVQTQQLTGNDGRLKAGDQFGVSVGIDTGVIAVGSYTEEVDLPAADPDNGYVDPTFLNPISPDENDPNQFAQLPKPGVAYIYELSDDGNSWEQASRIRGSDPINGDSFGFAVDVHTSSTGGGGTAIVGASTKSFVRDQNDSAIPRPANQVGLNADIFAAGAAYVFRSQPQVQSVTPNVFFVNDPLVEGTIPGAIGVNQLTLTVVYDQPMNTSVNPVIEFPTPSEDPASTIGSNPVGGVWTAPNTYVAFYNLTDANIELTNIDVSVDQAKSIGGVSQLKAEPPNAVVTDIFSIDTRNPIPLVFAPVLDKNPALPAPAFINRSFSVVGSFDEAILNSNTNPFDGSAFNVSNGSISNFEFDGLGVYSFDVTPTAEGQVSVDLNTTKATDLRSNKSLQPPSIVLTYDITPPTVSLTPNGFDPTTGYVNQPFSLTATFSEIVIGFDISDVSVSNGVVTSFVANSDSEYTFTIDPSEANPTTKAVSISLAQGAATDRATNPSTALTPSFEVIYDSRRPDVEIASSSSGTVEGPFTVEAFFTENVSGLELSEFFVTNGVATDLVAVSESRYRVTIVPSLRGPVTVALNDGVAQDIATNLNTASNVFSIDYEPPFPQVVSVSPSELLITDSTVGTASWTLAIAYSEAMEQTATPQIVLSADGEDLSSLTPAGGTWNAAGTIYTQSYDISDTNINLEDIDVAVSGGISLVNSELQEPNPTLFTDLFSIDTSNPEVTLTVEGATTPFTVFATFSEPVENFDISDLAITNGELIAATITAISETRYSFQVGYGSGDDLLQPISVVVNPGAEEIGSGNLNQASEPLLIDANNDAPVVSAPSTTVQSATGNTAFVFSASEGNAITISDPDAGAQDVLVTLTGNSGTVSVIDSADVTVSGNGTSSVTVQGSLVDINTALDGASFKAVNLAGSASLTIDVDDLGNVGIGGPKTDSETVNFAVEELTRHDFNSDGFSDFLWREPTSGINVMWFIENNVFNGNGAIAGGRVPGSQFEIQGTGDINLDGKQDLIWRNFETGATFVWFMDGGQFIGSANIMAQAPQGPTWFVESVADINRDGKADLLWRNRVENTIVAWYLDSGDNGDNIQLTDGGVIAAPGLEWSIKGTGDFNNDGNPDIVWSRTDIPLRVVWYMDGLNLLPGSGAVLGSNVPVEQRPGLDWEIQAIGDYNGDGNDDLVWRNAGTSTTVIWNMNNTDVIGAAVIEPNVAPPFAIQLN